MLFILMPEVFVVSISSYNRESTAIDIHPGIMRFENCCRYFSARTNKKSSIRSSRHSRQGSPLLAVPEMSFGTIPLLFSLMRCAVSYLFVDCSQRLSQKKDRNHAQKSC